jgi:hypothetical protein
MAVGYMLSVLGIRLACFGVKAFYGLSSSPFLPVLLSRYFESMSSELSANNLIAFARKRYY